MISATSAGRRCFGIVAPLLSRVALSLSFGKVLAAAGMLLIATVFLGGHVAGGERHDVRLAAASTLTDLDSGLGGDGSDLSDWWTSTGGGRGTSGATGYVSEPTDDELPDWTATTRGGGSASGIGSTEAVSEPADDSGLLDWVRGLFGGDATSGSDNGSTGVAQNSAPTATDGSSIVDRILGLVTTLIDRVLGGGSGGATGSGAPNAHSTPTDQNQAAQNHQNQAVQNRHQSSAQPVAQQSGTGQRQQPGSADGDELAQRITSLVQSWLAQNDLAQAQKSPAGSAPTASSPGKNGAAATTPVSDPTVTDRLRKVGVTGSNSSMTGPGVEQLFSTVVDLVSGVVSTVGGRDAGQRTHQALSRVAGQVESALEQGAALGRGMNAAGQGGGAAQLALADSTRDRTIAVDRDKRAGSRDGDRDQLTGMLASARKTAGCDLDNGTRCAGLDQLESNLLQALRGRGPPATHASDGQNSVGNSGDQNKNHVGDRVESAVAQLSSAITSLIQNFISRPSGTNQGQPGSAGRPQSPADLGQAIGKLTQGFVSELLSLVGRAGGSAGTGTSGGSAQTAGKPAAPSLTDVLDRFVDAATGVVRDVAGKKAAKKVGHALDDLSEQVSKALTQNSAGQRNPGQTGSPAQSRPSADLGQTIGTLTHDFARKLLQLVGGNTGTSGQTPQRPAPNLSDAFDRFTDLATGIVRDIAGKKAATKVGHALDELSDQLSKALTQNSKPPASGTQNNTGQQKPTTGDNLATTISRSVNTFLTDLLGKLGITKPTSNQPTGGTPARPQAQQPGGSLAEDITALTTGFVQKLLKLVGTGSGQVPRRPSAGDALGHFVDVASGLVSQTAGKKAGQETQQALSSLFEQLLSGAGKNGGTRPAAQTRPASAGTGHGQELGEDIRGLTAGFVQKLLTLVGGNTGTNGQTPQRPAPNLSDAYDRFTDLATGIVRDIAGKKTATKVGHALDELSDQLSKALTQNSKPS
ncbi:hypothetical protein, partial [Pseudonocardia spinosispora]|uniref:hypothetical protein n=1 Tax=Pseudonocardia spinosispora TaxID=103441 RepID=UPI00056863B5